MTKLLLQACSSGTVSCPGMPCQDRLSTLPSLRHDRLINTMMPRWLRPNLNACLSVYALAECDGLHKFRRHTRSPQSDPPPGRNPISDRPVTPPDPSTQTHLDRHPFRPRAPNHCEAHRHPQRKTYRPSHLPPNRRRAEPILALPSLPATERDRAPSFQQQYGCINRTRAVMSHRHLAARNPARSINRRTIRPPLGQSRPAGARPRSTRPPTRRRL